MGLSEADADKWPPLLEEIAAARLAVATRPTAPVVDHPEYVTRLRHRQKRLAKDEIEQLMAAYRAGLTVYQLARQFGCHRTTVSACLKSQDTRMRRTPPSREQIEEAMRFYEDGFTSS